MNELTSTLLKINLLVVLCISIYAAKRKERSSMDSMIARGNLINRVSIDQRPAIVYDRSLMDDWEVDTSISKSQKRDIVSDRKKIRTCSYLQSG